jgi:outer membrane protein assembly factor BamB
MLLTTMLAMPSPVPRRRLRRGLLAAAVVLVVAGGVVAFVLLHAPGNVSHPNVQFTSPATTATTTTAPKRRHHVVDSFQWPWYGFDAGRTRDFAGPARLRPPLHVGWRFQNGALLEFSPVLYHGTMFVLGDDGLARALSTTTGHVLWFKKVGTLASASPAVAGKDGLVVMPVLSVSHHSQVPGDGSFVALSMKTGRIVWSHPIPAGSESSPIVHGQTVYFGDQSGTLSALRLGDGHVDWTYHASGAIKGGPALVNGVLYFGDYAGRAYAVRASNGHEIWAVGTNGARFGFGSGQFYATPAVAFGRVYMGNTDGRVYSFGARTGALAWATGTGAYVYASAAVADPPGLGPTVYVGSYDGNLYAFNARSGAVRWTHPAGERISGAATVIGNVVYFSALRIRKTLGLDVVTGRPVFSFPDGDFTPVIADNHAIYLDGYSMIYQLLPGAAPSRPKATRRPRARHRATRHRSARRRHVRRSSSTKAHRRPSKRPHKARK